MQPQFLYLLLFVLYFCYKQSIYPYKFMKSHGSVIECAEERMHDLLMCYRKYMSSCEHIFIPEVFEHVVNMPASRFYVSEQRATNVISQIIKGSKLKNMRPTKREMFFEIYRRFLIEKKAQPNLPMTQLVGIVIEQPAPKFYLAPGSARVMILKARKKWYEERKKKLYRLL